MDLGKQDPREDSLLSAKPFVSLYPTFGGLTPRRRMMVLTNFLPLSTLCATTPTLEIFPALLTVTGRMLPERVAYGSGTTSRRTSALRCFERPFVAVHAESSRNTEWMSSSNFSLSTTPDCRVNDPVAAWEIVDYPHNDANIPPQMRSFTSRRVDAARLH